MIEFSVKKIKICLNFSFFATITLLILVDTHKYAIFSLYACIVHELGHLMMMQILGVKADKIVFYGAGIKINIKNEKFRAFGEDILILLSGCAVNFITCIIFMALSFGKENLLIFSIINLFIGIFNLLPLKCFDGGKIIDLIIENYLSVNFIPTAKNLVKIVSVVILLGMLVWFFINKNTNFTLYVTLSYFLFSAMLL